MVAMVADYRVASRHQAKPVQCLADARSCLRWIRTNAERLGIDPNRVAAAGGSAGGHLAAALATLPAFAEPGEDTGISTVPNALVLFNPAVVLAPWRDLPLEGLEARFSAERFGVEPEDFSPIHHVRPGTPPTIIVHGKADASVPYFTVEAFARAMKEAGNRCELVGYEGQPHGFFNADRGDGRFYRETLAATDRFLVSLGYLPAEPGERRAAADDRP